MAGSAKAMARIARAQHGVVTAEQLCGCGIDGQVSKRLVQVGRLERLHPGVFRVGGAPTTYLQRVLAAVLAAGPGAAASHRTAAVIWKLVDAEDVVEVTVPYSRVVLLHGVVVHRSRDLERRFVTRRDRIPVTNPMMTLADLGAVLRPPAVEDALDLALTARLTSILGIERVLDDIARPGRRGAGVLRRTLDERALGTDRADGLLEPRMARLMRAHGLPPAVFQHPVLLRTGRARIDFAYPDKMLAIEVDGYEKRASPKAMESDLDRQNALVAEGWTVLRFTWNMVVRRPAKVAAEIRECL